MVRNFVVFAGNSLLPLVFNHAHLSGAFVNNVKASEWGPPFAALLLSEAFWSLAKLARGHASFDPVGRFCVGVDDGRW